MRVSAIKSRARSSALRFPFLYHLLPPLVHFKTFPFLQKARTEACSAYQQLPFLGFHAVLSQHPTTPSAFLTVWKGCKCGKLKEKFNVKHDFLLNETPKMFNAAVDIGSLLLLVACRQRVCFPSGKNVVVETTRWDTILFETTTRRIRRRKRPRTSTEK